MLSCYQPFIRRRKLKKIFGEDVPPPQDDKKEESSVSSTASSTPKRDENCYVQEELCKSLSSSYISNSCSTTPLSSSTSSPMCTKHYQNHFHQKVLSNKHDQCSPSSLSDECCSSIRLSYLRSCTTEDSVPQHHLQDRFRNAHLSKSRSTDKINLVSDGSSNIGTFTTSKYRHFDGGSLHQPNILSTINSNILSDSFGETDSFDQVDQFNKFAGGDDGVKNIRATKLNVETLQYQHVKRKEVNASSSNYYLPILEVADSTRGRTLPHNRHRRENDDDLAIEQQMTPNCRIGGPCSIPSLPSYCHSGCCCITSLPKLSPRARVSHASHHPPIVSTSTYTPGYKKIFGDTKSFRLYPSVNDINSINSNMQLVTKPMIPTDITLSSESQLIRPFKRSHVSRLHCKKDKDTFSSSSTSTPTLTNKSNHTHFIGRKSKLIFPHDTNRRKCHETDKKRCSKFDSCRSASSSPTLFPGEVVKHTSTSKSSSNNETSIKNRSANSSFLFNSSSSVCPSKCVKSSLEAPPAVASAAVKRSGAVVSSPSSLLCTTQTSQETVSSPIFSNLCSCATLAHHYKALPHAPLILQNSPSSLHAHTFRSISHVLPPSNNVVSSGDTHHRIHYNHLEENSNNISGNGGGSWDNSIQTTSATAAITNNGNYLNLSNEALDDSSVSYRLTNSPLNQLLSSTSYEYLGSQARTDSTTGHHSLARDILRDLQKTLPREIAKSISSVPHSDKVESVMFLCADNNCLKMQQNHTRYPRDDGLQQPLFSGGNCILKGK